MRFVLQKLFGDSVRIRILEALLKEAIEESKKETLNWSTISEIARKAGVAKSSSKRIIDMLIAQEIVEEKRIQTHAQTPPRLVRLNIVNPAVSELLFFYRKIRGFL